MKTTKMLAILVPALILVLVGNASGQLSPEWRSGDIGEPTIPGGASYDPATDTWTIAGEGYDIWDLSDDFQFVYKYLRGDGYIIARVVSVDPTHEWAKAGVMIREDLTGPSKHATIVMTPTAAHGPVFEWRLDTGGASDASGEAKKALPYWVRINRSGDIFEGFISEDNTGWTRWGLPQIIYMSENVYIGLVVSSYAQNSLCTAAFDSVVVFGDTGGPDNDWRVDGDDMYAIPNGNVGIGTTNPTVKLEVNGTVDATAFVGDGSGISGTWDEEDNWYSTSGKALTTTSYVHIYEGNLLRFWDSGNVLLGNIYAYGNGLRLQGDSGADVYVVDGGANGIIVKHGGNVGIGTSSPATKLEVDGDLKVTGAYKGNITSTSNRDGAPFPRPAYDSGWQQIEQATSKTFIHNIGGNVDNYVVDLQFDGGAGISNAFYGTEHYTSLAEPGYVQTTTNRGAYWHELTTTQIKVYRASMDFYALKVRVRIWVYN